MPYSVRGNVGTGHTKLFDVDAELAESELEADCDLGRLLGLLWVAAVLVEACDGEKVSVAAVLVDACDGEKVPAATVLLEN